MTSLNFITKFTSFFSLFFIVYTPVYAEDSTGGSLFEKKCLVCHGIGNAAYLKLIHRFGPEKALLTNREDLRVEFVNYVVRNGIGSMPAVSRGDTNDQELNAIARYLQNLPEGDS